ncbi:MAG: hypothetical protein PHW77_00140 [Eubacteriales bacterium]|nr:hypothetical protein [Eubacteriales bacterium]
MKKLCCSLVLLILFFNAFPIISFAEEAKTETVDPYEYLGVNTFDEVMEYISIGRDKDYNPLKVKSIDIDIVSQITFYSMNSTENSYPVSLPSMVTIEFTSGSSVNLPFSTGEIVHMDDEWRLATEEFDGTIVIDIITGSEGWGYYSYKAYFIGSVKSRTRLGRVEDGNVESIYTNQYTAENPLSVNFSYRTYLHGDDTSDDNWRQITVSFESLCYGAQWFKFIMTPGKMVVETTPAQTSDVTVSTDADETAGETSIPVPVAIVVGVLGIGASLAAAAGITGGGDGGDDGGKKNSKYKLCIKKDFGDSIAYNRKPVTVYARMCEITPEGRELDRPDLTSNIRIFSSGNPITVDSLFVSGNYMAANISAEAAAGTVTEKTGIISFAYTGEGGTFRNDVTFRLIGEPYISFPEQKSYSGRMFVDVIAGDGCEYELTIDLCDFTKEAENVKFASESGEAKAEFEKIAPYKYKAIIHNLTSASSDKSCFARVRYIPITVTAENDIEKAENVFELAVYPEGLSVRSDAVKDDKLCIRSYDNPDAGDLDYKIKPTRFDLVLAVREKNAEGKEKAIIADMKEATSSFAKLKGTGKDTEELLKAYKYKLDDSSKTDGIFRIIPETSIPELGSPYYVTLPVRCEYRSGSYSVDIPCRLVGEREEKPSERDIEYRKLIDRVKRYVPEEEWSAVLKNIKSNADTMSIMTMHALSKSIIYTAQARFLNESESQRAWADALDWMIYGLEWAKWFGDQAFAYLATVYTGPVGEALLSPAKEILTNLIGEVGVQIVYGEKFDFESLQIMNNLSAALDNLIMTSADPSRLDIRQMATVLAGFLIVNAAKNYVLNVDKDGKRDFYKAITDAFGNLTVNAMKILCSDLFGKAMKSQAVKSAMNTQCGKWIKTSLVKYLPDMDIFFSNNERMVSIEKLAILDKYISEICGLGAATVFKKASESVIDFTPDDVVFSFVLWENTANPDDSIVVKVSLKAVGEKLYNFMFNALFGAFPFALSPVDPPKDPPFIVTA